MVNDRCAITKAMMVATNRRPVATVMGLTQMPLLGEGIVKESVTRAITGSAPVYTLLALLLLGCAEYTDTGEFVRHHFGYVKVTSPPVSAPDVPVRVMEVETFGTWLYTGGGEANAPQMSAGGGIGYQYDRREHIPLDCRLVIRLASSEQIDEWLRKLESMNIPEGGICAIQDSQRY